MTNSEQPFAHMPFMKSGQTLSLDSHPRSVAPLHFATGLLIFVCSTRGVVHSVAHVGLVEAVELVPLKQYLKMTSVPLSSKIMGTALDGTLSYMIVISAGAEYPGSFLCLPGTSS